MCQAINVREQNISGLQKIARVGIIGIEISGFFKVNSSMGDCLNSTHWKISLTLNLSSRSAIRHFLDTDTKVEDSPVRRYLTDPLDARILHRRVRIKPLRNGSTDERRSSFFEKLDELLLLLDQCVDLGGLAVEVGMELPRFDGSSALCVMADGVSAQPSR